MHKTRVQEIDMTQIDRPKAIAREKIDPEKIRELAESIREIGLQEPVILRPADGRYEIVAGDRRYLASKIINAKKILAIVKDLSDEETLLIRATENDQREDLTPMERARQYGALRDTLKYNIEKIARKMGRTHQTVIRYLGLLELDEKFQLAVDRGQIAIDCAYQLRKIDDPQMRNYYLTAAVENGITVDVARKWVEDYISSKEARFYDSQGGGGLSYPLPDSAPVYQTCSGCRGPVAADKMRYIGVCLACEQKLKGR